MDTSRYKTLLEAELALVTDELNGLGVQNPDNPKDWVAKPEGTDTGEADENVSADHAEDLEEREAILADLEFRYNATTRALKKIAEGAYGVCEIGNEEIEPARLEANPAARTCTVHMNEESSLTF